ncbi:unnamed protein product, partial [Ectocarpus sp. 12 AP-2014]
GGYLGDSGDCSSGEDDAESNDAEEMPLQPSEGFPQHTSEGAQQDPLEGCPPGPADQNSAARRSPRILPPQHARHGNGQRGQRVGPLDRDAARTRSKLSPESAGKAAGSGRGSQKNPRNGVRRGKRRVCVQAQEERLKIFAKGKDILFWARVSWLYIDAYSNGLQGYLQTRDLKR